MGDTDLVGGEAVVLERNLNRTIETPHFITCAVLALSRTWLGT